MTEYHVAVSGVRGRMGQLACEVLSAAPGVIYSGGFARSSDAEERVYDDPAALIEHCRPQILIDFTTRPATQAVARACVERGVIPIIGSSEWNEDEQSELDRLAKQHGMRALLVPNFAIGAVLMMRFSQEAAKYFSGVDIIEMHRADKRDKPSGTAAATAKRIAQGGFTGEVPIHSVRLPGLLAHQAVMFGNTGEVLTIRHDSLSLGSFASGILAAVRGADKLPLGLSVGLECVLQ